MLKTKRKKCSDFMPEDGNGVLRKEMGLEWMLRPSNNIDRNSAPPENEHEATQVEEAIDEAEDEWGQHDMKKVIPTSGNLRNVIPENFSYFHVEFGLDRGFVHVIDDDRNFPSSFGLNVVRGMLRLPEPNMHRHQRRESTDKQKQAVTAFVQEWEPFDWTKGLD